MTRSWKMLLALLAALAMVAAACGSDATDAVEDAADAATDAAEEVVEEAEEAMEDDDEAMEEEAMEEEPTSAASTDAEGEFVEPESGFPVPLAERLSEVPPALPRTNNVVGISELVDIGVVLPEFGAIDLIEAGVNPDCLAETADDTLFGVAILDAIDADSEQLVIIEFLEDQISRIFEAEDCALLG